MTLPGSVPERFSARRHLEDVVLPWWDANGADDEHGGVFTCFSNRGTRESEEKYTWSQGRWAWLCAELARDTAAGLLDGNAETWAKRSIDTARFIVGYALLDDGHTAFRLTGRGDALPSGEHGELSTSVFADLFGALGLTGAASLPECPDPLRRRFLAAAETILESASRRIGDRSALSEPYPVRTGFTDLAGPMTLLHVGSELSRVSGSSLATSVYTDALADLLHGRDAEAMWTETSWWEFRPDSAVDDDTLLARHKTPGHLLECLWMVLHAVDASDDAIPLPDWLADLAVRGLELGWDDREGGLFRYVDQDGGVPLGRAFDGDRYETLVEATWDTKLWWVHAEAMYATKLLARRFGRRDLELWNRRVTEYTLATFPDPLGHEWVQIRDRGGAPLDRVVALPVKDPFHIARSLMFLNRLDPDADTTARTPTTNDHEWGTQ